MTSNTNLEYKPMMDSSALSSTSLSSQITIILVTSVIPSHPSTEMTELVVSSFGRAKGLQGCRLLIVADGPRILSGGSETTKSGKTLLKNGGGKDAVQRRRMRPKQGIVDAEGAARYTAYKQAINKLCGDPCIPFFCNAELIELESRVGFGHAVQKGLALARTDYVCVVQHDRAFLRNVDMHC
eukprot:UC1_evm1s910